MTIYAVGALVVLFLLAAGLVAAERYTLGEIGGVPARLDRFTGEVIGCLPTKGCFRLIPPGEPQLGTLSVAPAPKAATPGGPADGVTNTTPAAPGKTEGPAKR